MPIQKDVRCAEGGGLSLLYDVEETVAHTQSQTKCILADSDYGEGTLFITSKRVVWLPNSPARGGISLDYPSLVLHAVSKESYSAPCIYCQIDANISDLHEEQRRTNGNDEQKSDHDNDDNEIPEMRFYPADNESLDIIFKVMSEMASLNPDPNQRDDCDSDEDDFAALDQQRWASLQNGVNTDDTFEDAEENDEHCSSHH